MSGPIVLGIESTCDETAASVVQGRTLISNVVASSMDEHARYGGVTSTRSPCPQVLDLLAASPLACPARNRLPGRRISRFTASTM